MRGKILFCKLASLLWSKPILALNVTLFVSLLLNLCPLFKEVSKQIDPGRHPGAPLLADRDLGASPLLMIGS